MAEGRECPEQKLQQQRLCKQQSNENSEFSKHQREHSNKAVTGNFVSVIVKVLYLAVVLRTYSSMLSMSGLMVEIIVAKPAA